MNNHSFINLSLSKNYGYEGEGCRQGETGYRKGY